MNKIHGKYTDFTKQTSPKFTGMTESVSKEF